MKLVNPRFGLVLTGGGAKGAYQAGALEYIAELGLVPQIIAGTSIGAIGGAILASHQSFSQGVSRLNEIWYQLGQEPVLRPNPGAAIDLLSYDPLNFSPMLQVWSLDFLVQQGILQDRSAIFDPAPIERFVRQAVDPAQLRCGIELWVTVFPSLKIPGLRYDWLLDFVRARTGTDAHWLCAQDFTDDATLFNLLLASAALPLAFPSRKVNEQIYVDGGLAGNIPMQAIAARGCTHAIIIHLENGRVWNRRDFPGQTVIEIRPQQSTNKSDTPLLGEVRSMLDFSASRIAELQQCGYQDAKRCLEPIIHTFSAIKNQRQSHHKLIDSTRRLLDDQPL